MSNEGDDWIYSVGDRVLVDVEIPKVKATVTTRNTGKTALDVWQYYVAYDRGEKRVRRVRPRITDPLYSANKLTPLCRNCDEPLSNHMKNRKCLFSPTYWRL